MKNNLSVSVRCQNLRQHEDKSSKAETKNISIVLSENGNDCQSVFFERHQENKQLLRNPAEACSKDIVTFFN